MYTNLDQVMAPHGCLRIAVAVNVVLAHKVEADHQLVQGFRNEVVHGAGRGGAPKEGPQPNIVGGALRRCGRDTG